MLIEYIHQNVRDRLSPEYRCYISILFHEELQLIIILFYIFKDIFIISQRNPMM